MGRKSSQTVVKPKQVAADKKKMSVRRWADKNIKNIILNQLGKGT